MNEFEDIELSRALGRLAGTAPAADGAFGEIEHRAQRIRRRRSTVALTAAFSVVAAGGAFALNAQRATEVNVAASEPPAVSTSTTLATTTAAPATTLVTTTLLAPVVIDTTMPPSAVETKPPSVTTAAPASAPTSQPTGGSVARTTVPAPTTPASSSSTCSSTGGSVQVTQRSGVLSLGGTSPAAGYSARINRQDSGRIEVEFRSSAHRSRVSVSPGAAAPVCNVRETDESEHAEDPTTSLPDSHEDHHGGEDTPGTTED